jgi:hypothetical protein
MKPAWAASISPGDHPAIALWRALLQRASNRALGAAKGADGLFLPAACAVRRKIAAPSQKFLQISENCVHIGRLSFAF